MKATSRLAIALLAFIWMTGAAAQEPAGSLQLLFDQGKRLFDAFQYDQALPLLDKLISTMTAGGPGSEIQKPELLVQAYELRARARFAEGDSAGAEQDFSALLGLKPDFALGAGVSPRVIKVLENVRRLTIGQLSVQVTPPGPFTIDGRTHTATDVPLVLDLKSGEHAVSATRANYTPFEQKVIVTAAETASLAIVLERVAATITVVTTPDDVEVFVDDVAKGRTPKGPTEAVSAPLAIPGLSLGPHRLRFKRPCHVDFDLPVTLVSDDVVAEPVTLTPAVATVVIDTTDREVTVVVDGQVRGPVGSDLKVCAGPHVIEVRGARGRFVDRREWKTGDTVTLAAPLRSAVPIIIAHGTAGTSAEQLRATLERALSSASRVLLFAPVPSELDAAMKQENVPADWLDPSLGRPGARLPKEAVRDIGRRLAARLGVQGVAAASLGADSYNVTFVMLAAGSGEPDVLTMSLADSASQGRVLDRLNATLLSLTRPSLETAFIDVARVQGAVVVRAGGASGLAAGDTVTAAAGKPVTSVADLRAAIAAQNVTTATLALDVKGPAGATRQVSSAITIVVDTLAVRDPALLANRALLDLQDAVRSPVVGVQRLAASINLSLVHMRLGNWDDALAVLKDVQLLDGPGVSAGTIAYLNGLAFEGLGRAAEAQAAFTKAAASPDARLWFQGPLVAPLAKAKLQNRR